MQAPFTIHHSDCIAALRRMPANSVDAIVTDPPYGLAFMGKKWDYEVPSKKVWRECLRVLKPGGHLLAFAGTRTQHRMCVNIEDAGFEIRDMIAWVYGSGFPKSLDVSKAIDKAAGAEREVIGMREHPTLTRSDKSRQGTAQQGNNSAEEEWPLTAPATEAATQWQGWGTALKPALEPITVARKPLEGTVATNVQQHGTGAMNVDGCRIAIEPFADATQLRSMNRNQRINDGWGMSTTSSEVTAVISPAGRWPANFIHDGSEEVLANLPEAPGQQRPTGPEFERNANVYNTYAGTIAHEPRNDAGSAARFFYCAKASKADRDEGLDGFELKDVKHYAQTMTNGNGDLRNGTGDMLPRRNHHPTVKPTDLMRYLCRLVTPPGGTVLDPFTGSGSTGKAAILEGFQFIGIEREAEYIPVIEARCQWAVRQHATETEQARLKATQKPLFHVPSIKPAAIPPLTLFTNEPAAH